MARKKVETEAPPPAPAPEAKPGRLGIEYRKVVDLIPYSNNARTHSPEQVDAIAKSIKAYGWTNPILTNGANGILAGHGRLAAARLIGMEEVPVIELGGLTDTQKRAYVLADNQLSLNAEWDFDILREEVGALTNAGADMTAIGNLDLPDSAGGDPVGEMWKTPTIKFNITFDNADQQQAWFEFVRRLQQEYPDHPTLAARLVEFIDQLNHPEEKDDAA